jgi:hypothetical protein
VPPIVHEVLRSPGQPLDATTRAFFEPRFQQDFSHVRVHSDDQASESARTVNALAYTVGPHVVFDSGQYVPTTNVGQRLLAHELVHVVQQANVSDSDSVERMSMPSDSGELAADASAEVALRNDRVGLTAKGEHSTLFRKVGQAAVPVLQRQPSAPATPNPIKTVTVDGIKLRGASHSRGEDISRANTIFSPCRVRFSLRRVEPTNTESDSWLGGDTDMAISSSCTPTAEELSAYNNAGSTYSLTGRVRAFFVRSISGAPFDASSFHAGCGSATNEMVEVSNIAGGRELAHELGHLLLNEGNTAHSVGATNVMADPDPGTQLTPAQCTTIYSNA